MPAKLILPTLLFFALLPFGVQGQSVTVKDQVRTICKWDTLYVWARQGLILRDAPSKAGKKLGVLPYGTKIDSKVGGIAVYDSILLIPNITENTPYYLKGTWQLVMVGSQQGYVFDGFLSGLLPFNEKNGAEAHKGRDISAWLMQQSELVAEIVSSDYREEKTKIYKNQVIETTDVSEGGGAVTYIFQYDHQLGFKDALLLVHYSQDISYEKDDFEQDGSYFIRLNASEDSIEVHTEGLLGHIAYGFKIWTSNGFLFIQIGGGC